MKRLDGVCLSIGVMMLLLLCAVRFCQERAIELYEAAHEKTVGAGSKLDVTLTLVRLGLLYEKRDLIIKNLAKAKM